MAATNYSVPGIDKRWDLFNTSPSLVEQKFNTMKDFGVTGYNTAMEAINALKQVVQALALINRAIAIDTTTISVAEPSGTPPVIDINQFRVDYPNMPTDPVIVDATLEALSTFPDLVVGDTPLPNEVYVSSLLTAIKAKLLSDVTTGSDGISAAVENAIFYREYERSILEERDLEDGIAAEWSTRGWPLPNGALVAGIDQAKIKFTHNRLDISRDVMFKSWQYALDNYHFIITQSVGLETHLMNYAHAVATLAFHAADEVVKNTLAAFRDRTSNVREKTLAIIEKARAKIQYNLQQIQLFGEKINAFSAKIRGEADRVNAVARGYEAETVVFKASTDFDIARTTLDLKVLDTRMNQAIANANIMIKDKEIELKNYELIHALIIEAEKAIGQIAAQLAAGALSSVHAAVQIAAHDTANYSYDASQVEIEPGKESTAIAVANIQAGKT